MPHRSSYPDVRYEMEIVKVLGKRALAKAAKEGDFKARTAMLTLAQTEEERSELLVLWKVPLDNFDCLGVIQYD